MRQQVGRPAPEIRNELLQLTGRQSAHLFISIGTSERLANIMVYSIKRLKQMNKKVASAKPLKASVIVHWLKLYNRSQVQYMAGHRYVSSTESFLVNEMDEMIEDIEKYHPIGWSSWMLHFVTSNLEVAKATSKKYICKPKL